jgi:hypothetical protein
MICPSCAAQLPPVVWKLVLALVAAPLAIVASVALVIRHAAKAELAATASDRAPSDS